MSLAVYRYLRVGDIVDVEIHDLHAPHAGQGPQHDGHALQPARIREDDAPLLLGDEGPLRVEAVPHHPATLVDPASGGELDQAFERLHIRAQGPLGHVVHPAAEEVERIDRHILQTELPDDVYDAGDERPQGLDPRPDGGRTVVVVLHPLDHSEDLLSEGCSAHALDVGGRGIAGLELTIGIGSACRGHESPEA